ncbi:serine hydroxymethyltransferase [Candidatus Berkelbacteria bacterium CG10_big_fil_rev_8_21_14_0_10_41_12]|uniref:Serine hydroxymethyltransferase n=1 Tax=Candidatus Berkelbacteria bacterium CG10_big_fil_rev_8_21_14_0_10_41_12 TaxID=1974513 RepID=A0A2M6WXZ4_9BACT|nr:MAG: serine hydroxymethyltransferase [Candidatus Berkelbacteria bacterium CG10_big_fil_rev_8_21_14_0_10_41_12]
MKSAKSGWGDKVFALIKEEEKRQTDGLEMIASENYVSKQVLEATGSVLTNKYAEGYPGHRYYGGCEVIDKIESLAIERLKKLFGCKFANVQPHCGSSANMAAYYALIKPGDKLLGQAIDAGGHLTHGAKVSFSGQIYKSFGYGLDSKTGFLNYEDIAKIAKKVKPKVVMCGYSAYPRSIDFKKFKKIARSVNAYLIADIAHIAGLVATGYHQSPIGIADIVTSTTHKTLRGPRSGIIMTNDEELAKKINRAIFPALQGGPLEHVIAAKAVAFGEALKPSFKKYIGDILENMKVFAKTLMSFDFDLVTNGTDNHLILVDLRSKNLTGQEFESALGEAGITVNKNGIPLDPLPPKITSGIRVGTAALTTRGMRPKEMQRIAEMFNIVAENISNKKKLQEIKREVKSMTKKFPLTR